MTEAWKQSEGQVVDGKFHLRQYLGGSDHSAVFSTERGEDGRQKAAIKFIFTPTSANPESWKAQISRWQSAAKLSHPHLIPLFESGRCQLGGRDLLFVVMEYAEENLAQILPQRKLLLEETREMLPPVLDVLTYIHGQGLVHDQLKPANIMAVADQLKLSSDGICAAGEAKGNLREPATPYDAPESANGVTPASDIWSLCMILVEVLTQRPLLWDGAMQSEPVVPETVPPPFRNIASHCLRQDPQRRWTIDEIAASLQSPVHVPRRPADAALASTSPKPRFILPIVIAAVVLLLAVVAGPKLFHHPRATQPSSSGGTQSPDQPSAEAQKPATPEIAKPSEPAVTADTSASGRGSVIQQALPEISPSARRTIQGKIRVKVRVEVDSSGVVKGVKFESRGPSSYFANKTQEAARHWKFAPPQMNGQNVASVWTLEFKIGRSSTAVHPSQVKP